MCLYISVQKLYIIILYVTSCEAHVIMYYNCCICILVRTHRNTHTMNLFENHHNPQIPEKVENDGTHFPINAVIYDLRGSILPVQVVLSIKGGGE